MTKTSRAMSLILVLAMIMGMVPFAFSASAFNTGDTFDDGILKYEVLSEANKTAEVVGLVDRNIVEVVVPATANGYSIESIGRGAFSCAVNTNNIKFVEIKSGVKAIKEYAFNRCPNLQIVSIPDSVTRIAGFAFVNCDALTSVNIPNSVSYIGRGAFSGCVSINSINIPNAVQFIGECAFQNCESIPSVNIPSSLSNISICTFMGCKSLSSVTISEGVAAIGVQAFEGCKALVSVTIPSSVILIEDLAFNNCDRLTSVNVLSTTATIGKKVFGYYSKVTGTDEEGKEITEVTKIDNFTVNAYKSSTTTAYAYDNGFKFVEIPKNNATITAKAVKKTYKVKALKKAVKSFKLSAKANSGSAVTFEKLYGNRKITVSKAGKVTVKKGIKKGNYKVRVNISSTATDTFNAGNKMITLKINIKK